MNATPTLAVTNPILLWLFAHGWEEPVDPNNPMATLVTAVAIHQMAGQVAHTEAGSAILRESRILVSELARELVGSPQPEPWKDRIADRAAKKA